MTTTSSTLAQLTHAVKIAESIAALEAELAAIFGNHSAPTVKASAPSPVKGKRKISTAHRAKLAAAAKARWAKIKGMKAKAEAPVKSKAEAPVKKKRTISPEARAKMAAAAKARWAAVKKM